jgi:hypothetical protein
VNLKLNGQVLAVLQPENSLEVEEIDVSRICPHGSYDGVYPPCVVCGPYPLSYEAQRVTK